MNAWLRLWAVFVAAVASVLFLKALPPVIVLVLFVGGVATVNLALRSRARRGKERTEAVASALGLTDAEPLAGPSVRPATIVQPPRRHDEDDPAS